MATAGLRASGAKAEAKSLRFADNTCHLAVYCVTMHVTVRDSWTDERLDDFKERVDQRFDQVDRRFDRLEAKVEHGFARMDSRIDSVGKAIVYGSLTLSTTMIAAVIAVLTQA